MLVIDKRSRNARSRAAALAKSGEGNRGGHRVSGLRRGMSDVGSGCLLPEKISSHAAPAVISVRRTVALRFSRSGYSCRDHHTESSDISSNPGPILCGYNVKGPRPTLTYTARGDYTSTMTQRFRTHQIAALPLKTRSACRSDGARQPLTWHPQRACV